MPPATIGAPVMPPATIDVMPNTAGTPRRTVRIDHPEWNAALVAADDKGEVLAEEIREFVRRYPKLKPRAKRP